MTHDDRSLERAARSWLEEGPTQAPDRAVDGALARIQTTSQERGLALPWRLPTMNPLMRLAGAAIVAVLAVAAVFLAIRPSSNVGPPATPSPAPSTAGSVAPTIELPNARQLAPTAVIDLAGMTTDTIPLTTDGTDLWVGVDGGVIHIDGGTNATNRIDAPDMAGGNGGIAITPSGLWIADYHGGHIKRHDPTSGAVEVSGDASNPSVFYLVDGELWLGLGSSAGLVRVDQETGAVGPRIDDATVAAFGLGDIWIGEWDGVLGDHPNADVITRLDPATGSPVGTITVPAGAGCAVSGEFPNNVWASCPADFGTCPANRIAVRIDPSTNTVAATAKICGNPVVVIDGTPWFLAGYKQGTDNANSLVSVDPATGRLLAQLDLGNIDPNVILTTGDALWMSDEQGDRVVRYDLTEVRS